MGTIRQEAPQCSHHGCGNRTWSPTGRCYQHVNPTSSYDRAQNLPSGPGSAYHNGGAVAAPDLIYHQTLAAFPDMDGPVHPNTIREQVAASMAATMSIEVYRAFPSTDVPDAEERQQRLVQLHHTLRELCVVQPSPITDDHAVAISNSSEDRFGRGLMEGLQLTSYGVRKEWELANALGMTYDEEGRRYDVPLATYCMSVSEALVTVADDEYYNQLYRYPQIIESSSGRAPLNPYPVITVAQPEGKLSVAERVRRGDVYAYEGDEIDDPAAHRQQSPSIGSWLWGATKKAAAMGAVAAINYDESRTQRMGEREARDRQRKSDELTRISLKEAKDRHHPWY